MAKTHLDKPNSDMRRAIAAYINANGNRFDSRGRFNPDVLPNESWSIRPAKYRPDVSEPIAPQDGKLSKTLSKAGACALEVLPEVTAAASLLGLGAPILKKRFVTRHSAKRTSIASKYMAPLIPGKLPLRVWTPRLGNAKVLTNSLGRAVARWIPGLGWAMLAHDAYKFGACMLRDDPQDAPAS